MTAPKSGSGSFFYNNLDVHRACDDVDRAGAVRIISRMIETCGEDAARDMAMMMFAEPGPARQGSRG